MDSNRGLNFQKELVDISNVILNRNSYPGELLKHTHVLFTELEKINSVESFRHATVDAVILESGKAIDPFSAAHCLIDYCRTTRFMRALYDAVLEAKTRFSKKPIHIFYAGTGPYASLMLPLTTRFSPDEIQFSMVEVHPITFEMLKSTLNTLGFEKYVKNYINQDACTIRLSDYDDVHIIITETMQAALKKEPQVSITHFLAPQLQKGGIFIPEQIHVWAGLIKSTGNSNSGELNGVSREKINRLATLINLDPYSIEDNPIEFAEICIPISNEMKLNYQYLNLYTEIVMFKDNILNICDSGLTMPRQIINFKTANPLIHEVKFQYQINAESTGFNVSFN